MRRGQVAIYLLMVLVALFLVALLNVDVFDVVRGKNRVQNGGDAAALAAARTRRASHTLSPIQALGPNMRRR